MKRIKFTSNTHGKYTTIVNNVDYKRLRSLNTMKWCVSKKRNGLIYFQKRIGGEIIEIHRWIMSPKKGEYVDHINGDTLDNRRSNLRICTNAANLRNGKIRKNNTSGKNGVWKDKRNGKWVAEIKVSYKKINLGRSKSFSEAVKLREKAEKKYWSV